ncbi:DUF3231 family protein [Sporomusa sp.]|uniref:DUF3231 family protein n=1 Tax=Sporomusa sp. TaxID=2078658 RepID=UPI002B584AAA|nr:DUF3231 family protein [Sporomusa sp.]HWR42148.1 DUF3231 family protein [Sporomusa sp.]
MDNRIENIRLTAVEIATIWMQYQNDSMASCVLRYFSAKAEDDSIKEIIDSALTMSQNSLRLIANTFCDEGFAVPQGFGKDDVNVNSPRLFGDIFVLDYLKHMARLGLLSSGIGLSLVVRSDLRQFYQSHLSLTATLDSMVTHLMLSKGIYVRSPYIPPTKEVHFAQTQEFLGGLFEGERPLSALEITHLFTNIQTNLIGKALIIGFSQVAQSSQVRDYFLRGKEIAAKHNDLFSNRLSQEDLPSQATLDALVTDSIVPPFSDKLMMFHVTALIAAGIANYGTAISVSQRYDLGAQYTRLAAEIALYAEDGANILIENGWLEELPQAVNRRELAMATT